MQEFGFRYAGAHSGETGIRVIQIHRPLLPPVQSKTMSIPDRHGTYYLGYEYEPLEIRIEVALVAPSLSAFPQAKRRIAEWLSPEGGLRELIFDDEQDKKYKAVLEGSSELEQILALGKGELTFLIPDPFAYAVEDDIFTYTELGTYQFERQGSEDSYPLIQLEGGCTPAQKLILSLNERTISFSGYLLEGDRLMIDSELMTAKIERADGKTVSAINQLSSLQFPVAIPGMNTLDIQTAGEAYLTSLTITCRSRWK